MARRLTEVHIEQVKPWYLRIWADPDKMTEDMAEQLRGTEGITHVGAWFSGKFLKTPCGIIEVDPRYDMAELHNEIKAVLGAKQPEDF